MNVAGLALFVAWIKRSPEVAKLKLMSKSLSENIRLSYINVPLNGCSIAAPLPTELVFDTKLEFLILNPLFQTTAPSSPVLFKNVEFLIITPLEASSCEQLSKTEPINSCPLVGRFQFKPPLKFLIVVP